MFSLSFPFEDALSCYEMLKGQKKSADEIKSIEDKFQNFAKEKAQNGDSAAQAWLKVNNISSHEDQKNSLDIPEVFKPHINKTVHYDESPVNVTDEQYEQITRVRSFLEKETAPVDRERLLSLTTQEINKILAPLDALIGLGNIKDQIRSFIALEKVQQKRHKAGLTRVESGTRHMVFKGNPGTGKTTVARLLAPIFKELGLLRKGHIIEAEHSDLIGEYVGQTGPKTQKILKKASGGILFIDEAYQLCSQHPYNDFGDEAIATLIKHMEDHRDDLIVIVAGYTEFMEYFLSSNPGLDSRFAINVTFEDFSSTDLLQIFIDMASAHDYILDEDARVLLAEELVHIKHTSGDKFSNARTVRNLFEETIRNQADRVIRKNLRSKKSLQSITGADIPTDRHRKKGNVTFLKTP